MADGNIGLAEAARREAYATPIEAIDPSIAERFRDDTIWPFFERLRHEDPVHFTADSRYGPFWSITRFDDIVAVDTNAEVFSSASGVGIGAESTAFPAQMFIAMDPPKHDAQRKVVSPAVAPSALANLEPLIRERAGRI